MARGLSRDQSREMNQKAAAAKAKGGKSDLTPAQRAERDAAALAEKQLAKASAKAAGAPDVGTTKATQKLTLGTNANES